MRDSRVLAPGEWAVLALVDERATHGWALTKLLSPEGEVGRVWSFPRPLIYRALGTLTSASLVEEQAQEQSTIGPTRTIFQVTPTGHDRVLAWLDEPGAHVRDLRSLLMLKLLFRWRRGLDLAPLLDAQRSVLAPLASGLARQVASSEGFDQLLAAWRLETTEAALRFLDLTKVRAGGPAGRGT